MSAEELSPVRVKPTPTSVASFLRNLSSTLQFCAAQVRFVPPSPLTTELISVVASVQEKVPASEISYTYEPEPQVAPSQLVMFPEYRHWSSSHHLLPLQ